MFCIQKAAPVGIVVTFGRMVVLLSLILATTVTPYEMVYDQQLPSVISYLPGTSKVHTIDSLLHNRDAIVSTLEKIGNGSELHETTGRPTSLRELFFRRQPGVPST